MTELEKLKILLNNPSDSDDLLNLYLENASDIICDIRNSDIVEPMYKNIQVRIAVELFNKNGAEGQTGHSENSINRTYESGDISPSLLSRITPMARTHMTARRVIV